MLWGPENWDAIQRRTGSETSPHPLPDKSLRTTLKRLPGRTRMTLADTHADAPTRVRTKTSSPIAADSDDAPLRSTSRSDWWQADW